MFWLGFIVGYLVGGIVGIIIECICIVAGKSDIKPPNSHVDEDK